MPRAGPPRIRRTPRRLRVKICGITNAADARLAIACGADALGLVFYPASPRAVTPRRARRLLQMPLYWTTPVAVTVEPDDRLLETLRGLGFTWIQLSGHEDPHRVSQIRDHYGFRVIKALHVKDRTDLERAREYAGAVDLFLLDRHLKGRYGGTGRGFDWSLLDAWTGGPFLLAGGLDAERVARLLRAEWHPDLYGLDLSSRLESRPGKKDPHKVRELFRVLRGVRGEP